MISERLTVWWVDRYTRGLPPGARAERRAEIVSDLWEHRAGTAGTWATQLEIASRCLRGIPADLSWRRSQRRGRALPRRGELVRGLGWALAGFGYLFLLAQHAWFASALVGLDLYGADWQEGDVELWSRIAGVFTVALVGGALVLPRSPRLGATLVAAAAIGTAALMWWALPILGPVAVVVATAAAVLARRRRAALAATGT